MAIDLLGSTLNYLKNKVSPAQSLAKKQTAINAPSKVANISVAPSNTVVKSSVSGPMSSALSDITTKALTGNVPTSRVEYKPTPTNKSFIDPPKPDYSEWKFKGINPEVTNFIKNKFNPPKPNVAPKTEIYGMSKVGGGEVYPQSVGQPAINSTPQMSVGQPVTPTVPVDKTQQAISTTGNVDTTLDALRKQNALKRAAVGNTPPTVPTNLPPQDQTSPTLTPPPQLSVTDTTGAAGGTPDTTSKTGSTDLTPPPPQLDGTKPTPTEPSDYQKLKDKYLSLQSTSPEENKIQSQLDALNNSAYQGMVNVEGQPIAMPFISGQQAAMQRQIQAQQQPLLTRLSQLQAQRQNEQSLLESQLGLLKPSTTEVSAGGTLVDPNTGQVLYEAPPKENVPPLIQEYEYALDQGYQGSITDYQKDVALAKESSPSSYQEWQLAGSPGSYQEWLSTKAGTLGISSPQAVKYQQETNNRVTTMVDDALNKLSGWNTGWASQLLSGFPGNAKDFKSAIDSLKSNIAFGALQDMRNASKTGGALGQVSDKEEMMLSSVLGSLDPTQSKEQLAYNLNQIKNSVQRWNDALAAQGSTQSTGNNQFDWSTM